MANILLKNIPPNLHEALRDRAKQEHRSLNKEVISLLTKALEHFPADHKVSPPASESPKSSAIDSKTAQPPRKSIQDDLPSHLL